MNTTLTFLHTSSAHIPTFEALLAELDPRLPAQHIVDESLLEDARAAGGVGPELAARVAAHVQAALEGGARAVLCTCSSIGACAEAVSPAVLRVDRPMAARAVALGPRITVAATVGSTLAPTVALIREEAARAGAQVQIETLLCADAWPAFEGGDLAAYHRAIAERLRAAPPADVVVLAQASMAGAAGLCADLPAPILSSPRLGLVSAIELYHQRGAAA